MRRLPDWTTTAMASGWKKGRAGRNRCRSPRERESRAWHLKKQKQVI